MRSTFLAGTAALLTSSGVLAAPLIAQPGGVAPTCSIDTNQPKELAMMSLQFQQAKGAPTPELRKKLLMAMTKELDTKPERYAKNVAGYQYTLSEVLKQWAMEPGLPAAPTRGSLGFVTNPAETVDLVDAMDAAYKAILVATPSCENEIKAQRQNEVWLAQTQAALTASNNNQLDSAEYYAKRSLKLADNAYPHYVLANVANGRGDKKAAVMHWKHVVQRAGTDTNYRDLKNGSMYYIAMTQFEMASAAQGAEQQTMAREAAGALKELLAVNPENPEAANLMGSWADALTMAKDTGAIAETYAAIIAAPDKATDITATMGGVIATRANKADDALKLFEIAVQRNPNARDALRNLAATYYAKDKFKEMFEPSRKLVAIDPNNYDGWMMFAYAAQGLGRGAKLPAEKKAWTDSLVKYQTYADKMPVKVDVTGFTRGAKSASLTLSLELVAATGGPYDVTAEFLDGAGNVVVSGTESSGALKKGERKEVTIKADGANIVGYRYKPLK